MQDFTEKNFGYLIAFIIPGFVLLRGMSYFVPTINVWLNGSLNNSPSVGGFLFATLGSIAMGLIAHTIRWAIIEPLHRKTGISKPALDFSKFKEHREEFDYINEQYGRYYQFYGNMLVAIPIAYGMRQFARGICPTNEPALFIGVLVTIILFYFGSRDSLRKTDEKTADFMLKQKLTIRK